MTDSLSWEDVTESDREQATLSGSAGERLSISVYHQIEQLCRESRFLDALAIGAQRLGPNVRKWQNVDGRITAAKLAARLGGNQLHEAIIFRLGRDYPHHPEVTLLRTQQRIGRCPLARLWIDIKDIELPTEDTWLRARWLGMKGQILAAMRDFDRALDELGRAVEMAPDVPEARLELAHAYAAADQLPRAIEICRQADVVAPRDTPTVLTLAHYLLQSNQIGEAFERVESFVRHTQSGRGRLQYARMLLQRGDWKAASKWVDKIESFFPLADPLRHRRPKPGSVLAQISSLRADMTYQAGQYERSAKWSKLAGGNFYKTTSANLTNWMSEPARPDPNVGSAAKPERVQLDVPFKLQSHVTCAPATLTMLSRYWDIEVEHDRVVDEICHDGTAPLKQRTWANEQGLVAREFRVTFESACALIDAGIPFGLSTIAPGMGYIQVVCGYDTRRRVVLVQDPGDWCVQDRLPQEIIDPHRAFGPRGLVLVPADQAERLDAIDLPDADAYDRHFAIALALDNHDRATADTMVRAMQADDPDHTMTHWATFELAIYDANVPVQLDAIRRLREIHTDNDVLWLWETQLMQRLDRTGDVITRLRQAVDAGRLPGHTRLALLELLPKGVDHDESESLLRQILRDTPMSSAGLSIEANRLWQQRRHDDALELSRLAAMSSELDESYASAFVQTAKRLGRQDYVLGLLRERFERYGQSSHRPALTYAAALYDAMRTDDATEVLFQAIEKRPRDAHLICQAARWLGRLQSPRAGSELLSSAETALPKLDLLQARASLAILDGRPEDALEALLESADLQPLNPERSERIASLISTLRGDDQAIGYLQSQIQDFPHCRTLQAITTRSLSATSRYTEAIECIDQMLIDYYDDAWCWRERAMLDLRCGWNDQAFADAEQAVACDQSAASLTVMGDALVRLGRFGEAKDYYASAVSTDCDYVPAILAWLRLCSNEERGLAIEMIYSELISQRTDGPGLDAYYRFASATLDYYTLTEQLQTVCDLRPDSYAVWMLLATHHTHFRQNDDAEGLLLKKEHEFACEPAYWLQLGQLYRTESQPDEAIRAYERGLKLHPYDADLSRELAASYYEAGRADDAREVLIAALKASPADPTLTIALAQATGDRSQAKSLARKAALRSPESSAAWAYLLEICQKCDLESEAVDAARSLVLRRPHDVDAHLRLAEMLHREDQCSESLRVIADAMQIDRRSPEVHHLFARRLFEQKFYQKALEACSPPEADPNDLHTLNVLSTRILYAIGEVEDACQRLRETLQHDPTDLDSWMQLANWCSESGNYRLYDEATDVLIRRGGHLAVSHGLYAETLVRQNHTTKAIEHLQFALDLDSEYEFALRELMTLMIGEGLVAEADEYLGTIAQRVTPRMSAIARLMITGATCDAVHAVERLENLSSDESTADDAVPIAQAFCEHLKCDHWDELGQRLTRAVKKRHANAAVGYVWAYYHAGADKLEASLKQFLRLPGSTARDTAAAVFLSVMREACDDGDPEVSYFANTKTQAILKRLGRAVYRDADLWSHAIWVLLSQDFHSSAKKLAKRFNSVAERRVEHLIPAMLTMLYDGDHKRVLRMLAEAESMDPQWMTEDCRLLRSIMTVYRGTDEELAQAIGHVNKNRLSGPFLRIAHLISAGVRAIELADPKPLERVWEHEFAKSEGAHDLIDVRVYQLLRSRVAMEQGEKRLARQWAKGKFPLF